MVSCEEKKGKLEIAITQLARCHRELGETIDSMSWSVSKDKLTELHKKQQKIFDAILILLDRWGKEDDKRKISN